MSLRLGDIAPNFIAETTIGPIDFYEYLGNSWGILFSHPADFTPVCTTELGRTAQLKDEFARRNTRVLAVSVDPLDRHKQWIADINETQNTRVDFPIIDDEERVVADLYDMIHPNASATATVRSLFIIGPDKKSETHHHLSRIHRAQLHRSAACSGFAATGREICYCHTCRLAAGAGRDRGTISTYRRSRSTLPCRRAHRKAVSALHTTTQT